MKNIVLLCFVALILTACSGRPSIDESYRMFYKHIDKFDTIAKQACSVLLSSNKNYVNLNEVETFSDKQEHKAFSELLDAISPDISSAANLISGQCNVILQFFVVGFAGEGTSSNFYYNVVPEDSELVSADNLYKLLTGESKRYEVHFPLKNNWYLYTKSS